MNAIETKSLEIERGTFKLGPIDFYVREGEIFAILGRTGSGKTVLLETLAGFYQEQYTGDITVFGKDGYDLTPDTRNMGFVYQDAGLFPHLTVEQNIAYGLKMHKVDPEIIEEKISYITELFIYFKNQKTVSGNDQRRGKTENRSGTFTGHEP